MDDSTNRRHCAWRSALSFLPLFFARSASYRCALLVTYRTWLTVFCNVSSLLPLFLINWLDEAESMPEESELAGLNGEHGSSSGHEVKEVIEQHPKNRESG